MNIIVVVLVVLIFGFSCSSSGDNIKNVQVGKEKPSHPYLLHSAPKDSGSAKGSKSPYALGSDPKSELLSAPYNLPFYEDDIITRREYGKRKSYDPFWEGDDELYPYIVQSPYVPDKEHDYLSIFNLYKKPKIRAFLIGNASYERESLRYSINDVYLLSSFLEKALSVPKDSIVVNKNLSLSDFMESFTSFSSTVEDDELVLIYFSGYSKDDSSPIFADMKAIGITSFYSLLNAFDNDTVLIMDSSYLESDVSGSEVLYYDVRNVVETGSIRRNILRLYSNLVHKYNKEGKYKNHFMLRKYLSKSYAFLNELGISARGNGIFTLLLMSFFADFSHFSVPSLEVTYETVYSYINNMLSLIEEERGRAEGVILARPKKYPIVSANFTNEKNDYILFRGSWDKGTLYNSDNLVLRAIYKKAINLRKKKKYKLAANLFSNVLSLAGDYKQARNLLSSSYLSLAALSTRPDEAIEFYKRSLKYNPSSLDSIYGLVDVYKSVGDNDKARSLLMEAKKNLVGKDVDEEFEAKLNSSLSGLEDKVLSPYELLKRGYKAYSRKEFDEALDYFVRAREAFREGNNPFYEATCINNIGSVYIAIGDYEKALSFNFESLRIKDEIEDFEGIANTYNNIAVIYHKQKLYEKAIVYFDRSISLFNKLKFRDKLVAQCYINFSNTYLQTSNYEEAYVKQKEAVFILTKIRDFSLFKEKKKLIDIESKLL